MCSSDLDWFHNAYSFQEMEPNVVKKYIDISSKFVLHGYWIMSSVEGHLKSAGGQKENISLSMIDDLMPKDFHKVKLPPSNLEEMYDKIADTLIYRKNS